MGLWLRETFPYRYTWKGLMVELTNFIIAELFCWGSQEKCHKSVEIESETRDEEFEPELKISLQTL